MARLAQQMGQQTIVGLCLAELADICVAQNQLGRSVRLFAAAQNIVATRGTELPLANRREYEEIAARLARAHESLDKLAFGQAWVEGQAMTLERAVAYALSDP